MMQLQITFCIYLNSIPWNYSNFCFVSLHFFRCFFHHFSHSLYTACSSLAAWRWFHDLKLPLKSYFTVFFSSKESTWDIFYTTGRGKGKIVPSHLSPPCKPPLNFFHWKLFFGCWLALTYQITSIFIRFSQLFDFLSIFYHWKMTSSVTWFWGPISKCPKQIRNLRIRFS